MPRRIPTVLGVMTPFPYAVDAEQTTDIARAMMTEHGIHHLPVLREGQLAGIVSAHDVGLADAFADRTDKLALPVWAVCSREPYVVDIDARLDLVAERIADLHVGSALVTRHGKLAGIITTTDLCRSLAKVLRAHADAGGAESDDPDVA